MELRNKRNALWEETKAFLEEHRDEKGMVEASAVEQYDRMTADVKALGEEIKRLEAQMEMDAKLSDISSRTEQAGRSKSRIADSNRGIQQSILGEHARRCLV